jgi:hypothetical protein
VKVHIITGEKVARCLPRFPLFPCPTSVIGLPAVPVAVSQAEEPKIKGSQRFQLHVRETSTSIGNVLSLFSRPFHSEAITVMREHLSVTGRHTSARKAARPEDGAIDSCDLIAETISPDGAGLCLALAYHEDARMDGGFG